MFQAKLPHLCFPWGNLGVKEANLWADLKAPQCSTLTAGLAETLLRTYQGPCGLLRGRPSRTLQEEIRIVPVPSFAFSFLKDWFSPCLPSPTGSSLPTSYNSAVKKKGGQGKMDTSRPLLGFGEQTMPRAWALDWLWPPLVALRAKHLGSPKHFYP